MSTYIYFYFFLLLLLFCCIKRNRKGSHRYAKLIARLIYSKIYVHAFTIFHNNLLHIVIHTYLTTFYHTIPQPIHRINLHLKYILGCEEAEGGGGRVWTKGKKNFSRINIPGSPFSFLRCFLIRWVFIIIRPVSPQRI